MLHVKGTSVEDLAVQTTVRFGKTFVHQINNDIVGNYKNKREKLIRKCIAILLMFIRLTDSILSDVALKLARIIIVIIASCDFFNQLLHLNIYDLVFLSNVESILLFFGARGTHEDNTLRSTRCIRILKLQNAIDFFNDAHLRLATLELGYETLANILNTSDLKVIL